jgi:glycosyltransferase involved in cell wall biosynthesis
MKILYVVGAYGPRYIANEIHRELVQEFARRGHEVIVYAGVTPGERGDESIAYHDGAIEVERKLIDARGRHKIATEISRRVFHYPRFLPLLSGLRRLLRRHPDLDVIHADAIYPIGAITALAATTHRAAIVPSIHGGDLIDYPGYGYGRYPLARRLTRWTFGRSALVRVNSSLMADRARDLGCPPRKLRHVLVNIGDRFFDDSRPLVQRRLDARAIVARQHSLDPDAPLLIGTGRLLPLKGFHDLIAAMRLLRDSRPDARLIIAGPNHVDPEQGDQRESLRRAIMTHGLEDRVILRDSLRYESEMATYLAAADLLVAPAHIEGLNRVVAEAGSQGTPSIVTDRTGIAPLVASHGAGAVTPTHDPHALASAIDRLLDPATHAGAAAGARALSERFRSAVIADQLLTLYADAHESTTQSRRHNPAIS